MPEKQTKMRAQRAKAEGKSPTTQAGEYVREEMHHVRQGKHGAQSTKQAIAIGLSKARRQGVDLPPPTRGTTSTRKNAERANARGQEGQSSGRAPSRRRSRAASAALKRAGRSAASPRALSRQAKSAAARRGRTNRSAAARKGAQTKGASRRSSAAKKGARTRRAHAAA